MLLNVDVHINVATRKKYTQLCKEENCKICFEGSFASHIKSKNFSDKNKDTNGNYINPRTLFLNAGDYYIFECHNSKHEFETQLFNVAAGHWCPYPCCNKSPTLCDNDNCQICKDASFASSPLVKYYSPKNKFLPRKICKYSHEECIFVCEFGHEFTAILYHISNNSWCSECNASANEAHCIELLSKMTKTNFIKCRPSFLVNHETGKNLELDGYNEDLKLAIEYNGEQHYKKSSLFHKNGMIDLEKQQERDTKKRELCKKNGIYLITVPYYEKEKEKFIENEYNKYKKTKK